MSENCNFLQNLEKNEKITEKNESGTLVSYKGIKYYPLALEISFNGCGETLNFALLHDLNANSVTHGLLDNVECV